ncbi:MAG TPA: TolC family protein [Bryobacteraceae bacterium]|nr:TolC family protein [Bryobacteraceae bacterium]
MDCIRRGIAIICVLLLLTPLADAQVPGLTESGGGWFSSYKFRELPPIDLSNSNRLEQLLRGGNIYLSLQDAIALALENNLDIAIQRYAPINAEASLLRAKAGGPLRGVPTSVQTVTTNILSQVTGTGSGTGGGGGGSVSGSGGGAGGTIITATGTSIPNLDPSFYVAGSAAHRTNPQTNSFTTGTNSLVLSNKSFSAGIQKAFLTGTSVSLGWNNNNVKTNAFRNDYNPYTNANLELTISQRLLQGFGPAVNSRNIRIAQNNRKVSDLAFKQQVIATVSQVIAGYWDLVTFHENVKVRRQALELSKKLYEDNKKQVEIGTLAPIEIVRAEAEVASNQQALVNAETQLLQQETALKNALSRTGVASPTIAEARIIPTDRITVPEEEQIEPIQDLVAQALENRPELLQSRISIESTRIGLKGTKSQLLPSLDIQASFQNNALAGQLNTVPVPNIPGIDPNQFQRGVGGDPFFIGGVGTAFRQLFRRNFPDYSIAFQLNVPLQNRAAKADMIMDQVSLRQQELQQQRLINSIRMDVRNALIALQQARAAYQAAVKARELAEQTVDAEQKKYALGASTIFFVIQYQRDLAQARSQEVAAESAYAKAKVMLDQAVGRILEAYNISIEEAEKGRVSRPPDPLPAIP